MKTMRKLFLLAGMAALLLMPVQAEDSAAEYDLPYTVEEETMEEAGAALAAFQDWENIRWEFADGTLTITGEGEIPSYSQTAYPWYPHRKEILEIVIQEGITGIPDTAFSEAYTVTTMYLPASLTSFRASIFLNTNTLTDFSVTEGGRYYDVDGVLFSKDGSTVTLECYPYNLLSGYIF